jgi:hypothetical protein
MPRFQGPQIQSPPANFIIVADNEHPQTLFPHRSRGFHTAWVHTDVGGTSVIYVDEYTDAVTLDEVTAAQDRMRAAATDPDTVFGGIEAITVDGRRGWGWAERIESERRGLVQVAYRAIVPYDTVSYAIEFISGEPSLSDTLQPPTDRHRLRSLGPRDRAPARTGTGPPQSAAGDHTGDDPEGGRRGVGRRRGGRRAAGSAA